MNRTQLLAITVVVLLLFTIVYHVWAGWGLITIHAKAEPLGKVLASMERQGHANIQTDIAGDTPVTMDVVKVPLTDALETLSVVTESRWRLLFFVAGDKASIKNAELSWFGGQRPDGWKMAAFPMGGNMGAALGEDEDAPPPDPRGDIWTPTTAAPAPVQTFLTDAATLTNAGFAFPNDWNPTVKSTPRPGTVAHVIPKLVSAAGGHEDELFFLSKPARRGPRDANAGGGAIVDFRFGPEEMAAHVQAQINRLPEDERATAQANFNTQRAFWQSLRNMTDDERRQAMQQHMQDPQVQQQRADRIDSHDSRMSHDQRAQHMQNYVNRKLTAMGKM